MRRIFRGFCRNWFLIDRLHYLSSHSDFGLEFAGFIIEKRLPDSGSRRLSDSAIRGVVDLSSVYQYKGHCIQIGTPLILYSGATMGVIGKGQDRSKVMYSSGLPISLDPCMSFNNGSICSCWGKDVSGPKE
jgi:hypothetical protein